MKRFLFTALAISAFGAPAMAQARMQLHEEITGENCAPCASTNPGFWALLNGGINPSKIIHIAYMSPIPSSGWFYMRAQAMNDTRRSYYGINSAPNGKLDGLTPSVGLHPGSFTQAVIDARDLVASPLNISVTSSWNVASNYENIDITVTVTNPSAVATVTTGTLNLRTALTQTWNFPTAPGSNGETHFENVAAAMYPNTTGTSMPTTWAPLETHTYTISGAVPWFTEKASSPRIVAWLQNETAVGAFAAKEILNAAQSATLPNVPLDAAAATITLSDPFVCFPNGPATFPSHTSTIKNVGVATLTSANVYHKVGTSGAWASVSWTGSLATGASSTPVAIASSAGTVNGSAYYTVYDSVGNTNGTTDNGSGNNLIGKQVFVESDNALALPYNTSFETADQGKYYLADANSNGRAWGVYYYSPSAPMGHTGDFAAAFINFGYAAGESEVITIPRVGNGTASSLSFWVCHAQRATTNTDKLEVVYSTDCGDNWTSVWNLAGTALATAPVTAADLFIPTPATYQQKTVNISTVPANAIMAFRATSGGGNIIAVDDIKVSNTVSVKEVAGNNMSMNVFPNPAGETASLTFNLTAATEASIQIVDGLGRVVSEISNGKLGAGDHTFALNTTGLANGVYSVVMKADNGTFTQRMTVAK